jgi:putative ABC transport system permease protein
MLNDIRYALRTLWRNPTFAAVAILTLALGIGANTAIFSLVNGVLLRPLPFRDPPAILHVWTSTADEARSNHSAGDFIDIQKENQSLAAIAGYRPALFTIVAREGEPARLEGSYVTVDFFDVLGIAPARGRVFSRAADRNASERLVVLSDAAWKQLYSGEDAVGHHVKVDGEPHTVAGILPAGTEWPEGERIWVLSPRPVPPSPIEIDKDQGGEREVRYFKAIARLKPGVTLAQAQQDLHRVALVLQQRHPETEAGRDLRAVPLYEEIVGDVRFALLVLQFAVGLVLLIACANVSSLLLARATGRAREIAVRSALGASRGRLVRQLLTESLILAALGGVAGLLLGSELMAGLLRILPEAVPRADQIEFDAVVTFSTLATAVVTGALFGVLPALQASRADTNTTLKQGGERGSAARARGRSALVIAEIALTLVLLAGAGLLLNSLLRLQRVDTGFRSENTTLVEFMIPQTRYPTAASQVNLYSRLVEGLAHRGDVQAVGVGFPGPLRGSNASGSFFIEGRGSANKSDKPFANMGSVSGGYFAAMGVPLVSGRTFSESDTAKSPGVGIVSVAMARKYWPNDNAVGKRIRFDDTPATEWMTIVGVVGDTRQRGMDEDPPPILYIPYQQFALPFTNLAIKSALPQASVTSMVREQLRAIDPELAPGSVATLQQVIEGSMEQPRFRTLLLLAFACLALLLAAVGVYGLIGYSVAQRTREIGIRVALGAEPSHILRRLLREGLLLAAVGIGIGLVAALLASRVIGSFLFGVQPTDPATFMAVSALLLAVALLATYVPARRALHVDPITALRIE